MNTPTHFLMTAVLWRVLRRWRVVGSAVLLGSVAPDMPLYALSLGAYFYVRNAFGWSVRETFQHMFDTLYFEDPVWIAFTSVLHSPVSLVVGFAVVWCLRDRRPGLAAWLLWFLAACSLHSLVDIATHHDDGPVLLWPLDWSTRFVSPISYWDRNHYGRQIARLELMLNVLMVGYLVIPWLWRKLRGRTDAPTGVR